MDLSRIGSGPRTSAPSERQRRIREIVAMIPPGQVASYATVADLAGLPGRARLVARVLATSTVALPWHRVLRADRRIAFPPGHPSAAEQAARLRREGVPVDGGRVPASALWSPLADLLFAPPEDAPESGFP